MHQGHMHFNALEGGGARYKATWGREVVCMSVAPSGSICTCLAAGSGRPMRWQGWERHTLERCAWSQFRALGLAAAFATAHQRYMPLATAGTCRLPQLLTTAHQVHANGSDTAVTYTVGKERLLIRGGGMRMPSYVCVCVFVRVLVRVSVCACVRARVRVHVKCAHAFACLPRLLLSFCAVPRLLHHSRYLFAMPRYHFQSIRATSPCIRWLMRAHASAHGHTCTALFAGAALVPGGLLVPDHKPAQPVSSACLV